ncbi:MAG: UDP-N-acetylmuramate dehydrogenase [Oscillospiraceae bacterium]
MGTISEVIRAFSCEFPGSRVRENEPMSEHTSFRIGGRVTAMALPESEEQLLRLLALSSSAGVSPLIMGNGTNLLVTDSPLDMLVIKTCDGISDISIRGDTINAGSGVLLSKLASFALANSLTGLEFAHGIPGSLGGAAYMNAGAYGGEICDVVIETTAVTKDGEIRVYTASENNFSYRHSRFTDSDDIVLSLRLQLAKGDPDAIKAKMDEYSARRRESQPLNYPSAGSTFKRPVGGYAAAMIDKAGLRGYAIGGAQVSEKHAGFVINRGGATFGDVVSLMAYIKETVYEKFGVELLPEVRIIR